MPCELQRHAFEDESRTTRGWAQKRRGWFMRTERNIRTQRQPEDFDRSQFILAHPLERTTETGDVSENERPWRKSQLPCTIVAHDACRVMFSSNHHRCWMVQGQVPGSTPWLVSSPRSFSPCQVETRVSPASLQCGAFFLPFVNKYEECPTKSSVTCFRDRKQRPLWPSSAGKRGPQPHLPPAPSLRWRSYMCDSDLGY